MKDTCPNCGVNVVIEVTLAAQGLKRRSPDSPITPWAERAVREYIETTERREAPIGQLHQDYEHQSYVRAGWPHLSLNAFSRLINELGATRRRTARARIYTLPPKSQPEQQPQPVEVKPQTREEILADLPFQIDMP